MLTLRLLRRRRTSSNGNTQIHFQNSHVQFFLFYPFQCCLFTMEGGESYKIFEIELKQIKFLSYLLRQHTKKCFKKCSNLRIINRLISRYFPWKIGDNLIIPISISSLSKHYSLTSAKKPCTGFFDDLENLD